MADRWQPGFDVYSAEVVDGRAVFLVDLAAADHAPLASHPVRLDVAVELQRPRPDGLRADDEADALYAVEDRVVQLVESSADGLYVGRVTAGGRVRFVFYLPANAVVPAPEGLSPYVAEVGAQLDEDWSFFVDILMPGPYSLREMQNRRVLARMQELGDQLDLPREIDHLALFEELEQAARAAATLRRHGFRVDDLESDGEGRVGVQFHRVDHCAGGRIDEVSQEILDIVLAEDGEYDGWGAALVEEVEVEKAGIKPMPGPETE